MWWILAHWHGLLPVFILVILSVSFRLQSQTRKRALLPPGPPGLPCIGNLFQMSGVLWTTFSQWSQQYGPIVYISLLGRPVIVLNNHQVATDLLDRRSLIYSDRPPNIVASDGFTGGLLYILAQSGEQWRRLRKATHDALTKSLVQSMQSTLEDEAVFLVQTLLDSPNRWKAHLSNSLSLLIVKLVYGPALTRAEALSTLPRIDGMVERLARASYPGAHLVEIMPWMRHLPAWMLKWKRETKYWFEKDSELFEQLYSKVEESVAAGDEHVSLASTLVSQQDAHGLSRRQVSWIAATIYAAGVETTGDALAWFILAMVQHPEVQQQAHAELDTIVGQSRMPTQGDYAKLPYIRAIVKEILRWQPVLPLGIPHRLTQDDHYAGYNIPRGTICIPNVWAMNRDPDVYGEDAHEFNPKRHLNDDGSFRKAPLNTKDEGHAAFGFGNRVCIGRGLAKDTLFIDIASILWACTLDGGHDDHSNPAVLPPAEVESSVTLTVKPKPFRCDFKPRFPEVRSIVSSRSEFKSVT